jgi:hypothetical protein
MKFTLILCVFALVVPVNIFAAGIFEIQYNETNQGSGDDCYPSPLVGQTVSISGTVTGLDINGDFCSFFVQDKDSLWHGIYVYGVKSSLFKPDLWDEVSLKGQVSEYYGMTELKSISNYKITGKGEAMDPIFLHADDIDDECSAHGEAYEGCYVRIVGVEVTQEVNQYGEWYVSDDGGSHEAQIEDYMYHAEPTSGDQFGMIRGLVMYGYGNYEIAPRDQNDLILDKVTSTTWGSIKNEYK